MTSGIYTISCTANGKVYVGSSVRAENRMRQHRRALERGVHGSPLMQRAWDKYGGDTFVFALHEECPEKNLLAREQHWIDTLPSMFNISREPGRVTGFRHTDEERRRNSERAKALWAERGDEMRIKIKSAWENRDLRERRRQMSVAHWQDPEKREQNTRAIRESMQSDEYRSAQSERRRADWADPEKRFRILEGRRLAKIRRRGGAGSPP